MREILSQMWPSRNVTYTGNVGCLQGIKIGCLTQSITLQQSSWKRFSLLTRYDNVSQKVPTFMLSVTLSNLYRFSHFLHCWKAYEICYKTHTTLPNSP